MICFFDFLFFLKLNFRCALGHSCGPNPTISKRADFLLFFHKIKYRVLFRVSDDGDVVAIFSLKISAKSSGKLKFRRQKGYGRDNTEREITEKIPKISRKNKPKIAEKLF
jgi:hypothetical protein